MIQPNELKLDLPMEVAKSVISTTSKVWNILYASYCGNLEMVKQLVGECPELIYAQYNYTPPVHLAVREGHLAVVEYLLSEGAYDPNYKTYPFGESLITIAEDRGHLDFVALLKEYGRNPVNQKFQGDNGEIHYVRTLAGRAFEEAVDKNDLSHVTEILKENSNLATDNTFFWGEGILMMPAKEGHFKMVDTLMEYGATVPKLLKWTQAYYFERYANAAYMMKKGMNPDTMSWHHVTILHDMAQKGNIPKAELLLKYGADINPIEEEYQSTPLGLAARWGHSEMVEFLLNQGADPYKSGASWSTPLSWATMKGHTEIERMLRRAGAVN